MSDEEGFLSRWSRRKREDATPAEAAPLAADRAAPPFADPAEGEPVVDLTQLPPLDAIDAATDIRAFLTRGVPAALTNAALRRVWSADPAIRDYVGPAENAWDFTAPGGVPGFGPMIPEAENVAALAGQGGPNLSAPSDVPVSDTSTARRSDLPARPDAGETEPHAVVNSDREGEEPASVTVIADSDCKPDKQSQDVALQEANSAIELGTAASRRRHGGAIPG